MLSHLRAGPSRIVRQVFTQATRQRHAIAAPAIWKADRHHVPHLASLPLLAPTRRWLHGSPVHRSSSSSSSKPDDVCTCTTTTYKASILEEYDKPLRLISVKNDTPLGTEMVRISIHYCSINGTDVNRLRRTADSDDELLPTIPGCEFAGEVLEVGDYVTENLHKGDRVVALLASDHQLGGGLAQQSVVSELDCFQTGDVALRDAAVLVNGHGTAYLAFTKYCALDEGDVVIVIAGAAGNGLAAIQLAKNVFKAKVYVVCDTDDTTSLVRDEGAHKSVSIKEGLSKVYKSLEASFKEKKAKVVYDAVGGGLMYLAADFVDPQHGHYLSVDPEYNCDTFAAAKPEFTRTAAPADGDPDAFVGKVKHVNLYKYRDFDKEFYRQTVEDVLALCAEEIIVPYTSRTFGLHEVNEAVDFVRSKKCTGKVLIDVRQTGDADATKKKKDKSEENDADKSNEQKRAKDDD